jgi:hypothetical protein
MKTCWIVSENFASVHVTAEQLKDVGAVWGSWKTWRAWHTDNVLCNDLPQAQDLIQRAFHSVCNFYTANKNYADLGRPPGVNLYEGTFPGDLDGREEIIAMHLVAEQNDLVLLLGFDLTKIETKDKYQRHKQLNYQNAFRATLNTYPNTQFVLIDHPGDLDKSFQNIPNITCDEFQSVLQLLN